LDIVRRLAQACGDDFECRQYQRFTPLEVAKKSLARSSHQTDSYRDVMPGDCIVAFSRNDIFAIKREIETTTKYKCTVIYGSLPPQTRSEQARLFNDPNSGYDILVASDAIGMGLNLNIRRIVFNSIFKHDGNGVVRLGHSAVKQISGRAGRRNSMYPTGEVTTRCPEDMEYLRKCMGTEINSVERAGLLPTANHIDAFSSALEQYGLGDGESNKLHKTLRRFSEMASVQSDFFLGRQTAMHQIARAITSFPLTIREKYTLCMCPVNSDSSGSMDVLRRFASKLAAGETSGLTYSMVPRKPKSFDELSKLCHIFSGKQWKLFLGPVVPFISHSFDTHLTFCVTLV
jgi:ATP-dependent RNA helicase SUPV3L1/SUV3